MGCFSKHIMGGDEPWDAEAMLYKLFGVKQYSKTGKKKYPIPKAVMEAKQLEVRKLLKKKKVNIITVQVLGVLVLRSGAKFHPKVKEDVIRCLQIDSWAEESLERRILVNDMIDIINEYDAQENPEPIHEYRDHPDIPDEAWGYPRGNSKICQMVIKYFEEYCKAYPIVKKVSAGYDKNGYRLMLLVDDSDDKALLAFIDDKKFEWGGLFEIPVCTIFTSDFKSVENDGNDN